MKLWTRYVVMLVLAVLFAQDVAAQETQWRDMHKVKRKETIYSIARDYGITVDELIKANPEMATPDYVLKKGSFVCIPYPSSAVADTATVTPPSPQPLRQGKTDMREREIRVGVMLPLHKVNGD